jgi:transcriptional antiterminator RfaH
VLLEAVARAESVQDRPAGSTHCITSHGATGEHWYVVHTHPRAENRAISHLERQGHRIFCPRTHKTVRHARRAARSLAPLFPNYLFVRLDVTQGETPQPVPAGIVEALQARMGADGAMDWTPAFKVGQPVRMADGPFADFVGTLEKLDAAGRVRVLLDLFGRSVSVALRCEPLMPVA